jgi:hypothetical protein
MKPSEIKRLAKRVQIDRSQIDSQRVLRAAEAALGTSRGPQPSSARPGVWRTIMQNRATRVGVAAGIVIAVGAGVAHFAGSLDPSSVVLARAIRNIARTQSATWETTRTYLCDGRELAHLSADAVWYYSSEHGAREDMYDPHGKLVHQVYWLPNENVRIKVVPALGQYECAELTEAERKAWGQPDVQALGELVKAFQPAELDPQTIDGRAADVFQVADFDPWFHVLNAQVVGGSPLFHDDGGVARFWIDVQSSLPVRFEAELATRDELLTSITGGRTVQVVVTGDEQQWNVEIERTLFEPNIPADYVQTVWWPAGDYPAHDIPDEDLRRMGGIEEWYRRNPGPYSFFYVNRRGHCVKLHDQFVVEVAAFTFRGGPESLRDLHDALGVWFVAAPTKAKAYYATVDAAKTMQVLEAAESIGALTRLGQTSLTLQNGRKRLVDLDGFGSVAIQVTRTFNDRAADVGVCCFVQEQAVADVPCVKTGPEEAALVKSGETAASADDGTAGPIFLVAQWRELLR